MSTSFNLLLLLLTFFVIAPYPLATAIPLTMDYRGSATTLYLNLALPGFPPKIIRSDSVSCAISSSNGEFQLLKRFEARNYENKSAQIVETSWKFERNQRILPESNHLMMPVLDSEDSYNITYEPNVKGEASKPKNQLPIDSGPPSHHDQFLDVKPLGEDESKINIPLAISPQIQVSTPGQDSTSFEILKSIVYGDLMEVIASLNIVASVADGVSIACKFQILLVWFS
ncbi:hypothetical protein L1987_03971 [Smallanthus sonchifolius]|uniref:Uncharacterized protein n=1 Tax=Smallanthus sonchifolius TaxID=185202 RepID=A0ACB9KC77_9ASTR|nr:hypothetical protein L1987_03971 [Smallanthus sonchifolius]